MHGLLSECLLGDRVAADYLLCHLASRVYVRQPGLVLGKMAFNLFNVPFQHEDYCRRLATIVQLLATRSHYMAVTVDALNKLAFVPRKDMNANRLVAGHLQLAPHTHLILDETRLDSGQLTQQGVRNLEAVGTLIQEQNVEYDFKYMRIKYDKDVPCLVLSEGRSMITCDYQVRKCLFLGWPTRYPTKSSFLGHASSLDAPRPQCHPRALHLRRLGPLPRPPGPRPPLPHPGPTLGL